MKITNGIEHTQFIQLRYGIKKKAYGNLLDGFSVKRFCDTFTWYKTGQNWNIGNPKSCGWKKEDLNAYLPIDILKEDITGTKIHGNRLQLQLQRKKSSVYHREGIPSHGGPP